MNETQLNENPPSPPEGGDWQPVKVGRKVVTSAERDLTDAILAEFNRQAGTSYRGAVDHHRMIVGRIREAPELSQPEHARIIRAAFADAWWTGTPGPEVIYGKGSVFERAQETARRMRHVPAALSDDEVQKRREAAAAAEAVQRERDLDEWYRQNPDVPDPRKVSR